MNSAKLMSLLLLCSLSGCAWISQDQGLDKACQVAPELYTNLQVRANQRQYMLPNGQPCHQLSRGSAYVI